MNKNKGFSVGERHLRFELSKLISRRRYSAHFGIESIYLSLKEIRFVGQVLRCNAHWTFDIGLIKSCFARLIVTSKRRRLSEEFVKGEITRWVMRLILQWLWGIKFGFSIEYILWYMRYKNMVWIHINNGNFINWKLKLIIINDYRKLQCKLLIRKNPHLCPKYCD